MKRFLVMILFILLLTGCGKRMEIQEDQKETNMFVCIQAANGFHYYDVVYQKDTKVMYTVSHGPYSYGNFTMLVNPDGTPMLYKADEEVGDSK